MNLTFSVYRFGSMMFDEGERLIPVLCSCFEYVLRSADSNVNYQAVPPCLVIVLFVVSRYTAVFAFASNMILLNEILKCDHLNGCRRE